MKFRVLTKTKIIVDRLYQRTRSALFLENILNFRNQKRFSTYLVTTFVVLAILMVFVILIALYGYFGKRVEAEFRKRFLAEKGQVEIILNNRISSIRDALKNVGSDNIIRVTVMLDDKSQLEERVSEFYPPRHGVYFFVRKQYEELIIPQTYPSLSRNLIGFAEEKYPYGVLLKDKGQTHMLWWFSTPIMHQTRFMGTAYALYDMTQDINLIDTVKDTVSGDVSIVKYDRLYNLISGTTVSVDDEMRDSLASMLELIPLSDNKILSNIDGFDNLYFHSSLETLVSEKTKNYDMDWFVFVCHSDPVDYCVYLPWEKNGGTPAADDEKSNSNLRGSERVAV